MFVDDKGNFICDIKKTFEDIQNYKNNKNKNNNNANNNQLKNVNQNLFSETEIHLMDSIKKNYHIKIFTCFNENKNNNNNNNYSTEWNQLITLTLKNSETERKIEHIERWLFHFLG